MANRVRLDSTTLHYLTLQQAMVSVHRPVHFKIMLTYSLTWQTGCCTLRRMASKLILNTKVALSQAFLKPSLFFLF